MSSPTLSQQIAMWRDGSAGFFKFVEDVQPHVRSHLGGFAPYTIGTKERSELARALDGSDISVAVWCWPRRHGKTLASAMIIVWRFLTRPTENIAVVANSEKQVVDTAFRTIREAFEHPRGAHDDYVHALAWASYSLRTITLNPYEIEGISCNGRGADVEMCVLNGGGNLPFCGQSCRSMKEAGRLYQAYLGRKPLPRRRDPRASVDRMRRIGLPSFKPGRPCPWWRSNAHDRAIYGNLLR